MKGWLLLALVRLFLLGAAERANISLDVGFANVRRRRLQAKSETSDANVLCDFYNTMPAAGKAKLTNWCGSGDKSGVCGAAGTSSWKAVTCAVVGGVSRVTKLDTWSAGVTAIGGSLPISIGGLDALFFLGLGFARLTGTIPPSLGTLTKLANLALDNSALTGNVPSSLGGLTGLTFLGIQATSLTGPLPATFCSLKPLITLHVWSSPGLTCYPSCLSSYSKFNKGSLSACAAGSETSDANVLCDFYNTMPAAGKAKLTNWCGAKTTTGSYVNGPCTGTVGKWLGVTCAVVGGASRVTSLDTYNAGLRGLGGSLPSSIGGLGALTFLQFGIAGMLGTIPSSLGGLTGLTHLGLGTNALTGTIPEALGALTGLIYLNLDTNSLSGPLPSSFCSLQPSINLYLHSNPGLTCYPSCLSSYSRFMSNKGSLSAVCAAASAKSETSDANILCDFYNTMPATGKAKLTNWCGAKTTTGSYVNGPCTGTAGAWLGVTCAVVGGVSRVTKLDTCLYTGTACAGATGIGGSLPNSIGGLDALTLMDLGQGRVSGTIPPSLGALSGLVFLSFNSNSFSGNIPLSIGGLARLTVLALTGNALTGAVPSSLCGLQLSVVIDLRGDPGLTCYPSCLSTYSKFNKGSLSTVCAAAASTAITATPSLLPTLPPTSSKAETSDANVLCDFYNTMPAASRTVLTNWCGAKTTTGSYVNGPCTGTAGAWKGVTCAVVGGVSRVTSLNTNNANLRKSGGSLPASIGGLDALTHLDLCWATLSGTIPSTLGALTRLTSLDFGFSRLTGTIPTSLGDLTALTVLSLAVNSLSGGIPATLGGLTRLTRLNICGSPLSGTIPSSLGALTGLTLLYLHTNSLTGTIPPSLGGLTKMGQLYLFRNALTGPVPNTFCSFGSGVDLQVYTNPGLTCYPSCLSSFPNFMKQKGSLSTVCAAAAATTGSETSDANVLCDFYNTMPASPNKAKLINWCGAKTTTGSYVNGPCTGTAGAWYGVSCSVVRGVSRVTKLDPCQFTGSVCIVTGLGGSLPMSIGGLDALTFVTLISISLSGSIPSSLGAWTGVTELRLFSNTLTGSIPASLGAMTALTGLYLYNNALTGTLPASLCNLLPSVDLRVQFNPGLTCYPSCLSAKSKFMNMGKGSLSTVCAAACSGAATDPFSCIRPASEAQLNPPVVTVTITNSTTIRTASTDSSSGSTTSGNSGSSATVVIAAFTGGSFKNADAVTANISVSPAKPLAELSLVPASTSSRGQGGKTTPIGQMTTPEISAATSVQSAGSASVIESTSRALAAIDVPVVNTPMAASVVVPVRIVLQSTCLSSVNFDAPTELEAVAAALFEAWDALVTDALCAAISYDAVKRTQAERGDVAVAAIRKALAARTSRELASEAAKVRVKATRLYAVPGSRSSSSSTSRGMRVAPRSGRPSLAPTRAPQTVGPVVGVLLEQNVSLSVNLLVIASYGGLQFFNTSGLALSADDDDGASSAPSSAVPGAVPTRFSRALARKKKPASPPPPPPQAAANLVANAGGRPGEVKNTLTAAQKKKNMKKCGRQVCRRRLSSGKAAVAVSGPRFPSCLVAPDLLVLAAGASTSQYILLTQRPPRASPAPSRALPPRAPQVFAVTEEIEGVTKQQWDASNGRFAAIFVNQASKALHLNRRTDSLRITSVTAAGGRGSGGGGKPRLVVAYSISLANPRKQLSLRARQSAAAVIRSRLAKLGPALRQQGLPVTVAPPKVLAVRAPAVGVPLPSPSPSPGPSAPTFVPCSINCPALPEPCGFYQTCGNGCYCGTLQTGPTQFPTQMPTTNSFFFSQPQRRRRAPSPPPTRARVRRPAAGGQRGQRGQGATAPTAPSATTAVARSVVPTPVLGRPSAPSAGALSQPQVSPPLSSAPSVAPSSVASTTRPSPTFSDPTAAPVPVQASSQTDGSAQGSRGLGSGATGGVVAGCVVVAVLVTVAAFLSSKKKQAAAGPAHLHELYPGGGFTPYVGTRTSRGSRSSMRQSFDHASPMHHQQHHQQEQEHDQPRRDSRRLSITAPSSSSASSRGSLSHASPPSHPHRTSLSLPPGVAAAVGHQSFRAGASLALQSKQLAESGRRRQSHRPSFAAGDAL